METGLSSKTALPQRIYLLNHRATNDIATGLFNQPAFGFNVVYANGEGYEGQFGLSQGEHAVSWHAISYQHTGLAGI